MPTAKGRVSGSEKGRKWKMLILCLLQGVLASEGAAPSGAGGIYGHRQTFKSTKMWIGQEAF